MDKGLFSFIHSKKETKADTSNWGEFKFSEVFEIKKGKRLTSANMTDGSTKFIGATAFNNGETRRIGQSPIFKKNLITVSYNGSVGEAFYQEEPFWASDDINVLEPKNIQLKNGKIQKWSFNKHIALFLCGIIREIGIRFNYTQKWNSEKMKETKIFLPLNKEGNVDFDFMERYIKTIYDNQKLMAHKFLNLIHSCQNKNISPSNWKKFSVSDVFIVGKRGTPTGRHFKDLKEGKTPRISVSGVNNGITGYFSDVKSNDYVSEENFISFSFLGTCFYHPYKASLDMKVHILKPKEHKLNKYTGLFIVSVLRKQFSGTYGNQISSGDLKDKSLFLPEKNGQPDWDKMEEIVKSLHSKIEKFVS